MAKIYRTQILKDSSAHTRFYPSWKWGYSIWLQQKAVATDKQVPQAFADFWRLVGDEMRSKEAQYFVIE